MENANTKNAQINEQKENSQQVCPSIPTMPWNFEGASEFTGDCFEHCFKDHLVLTFVTSYV